MSWIDTLIYLMVGLSLMGIGSIPSSDQSDDYETPLDSFGD